MAARKPLPHLHSSAIGRTAMLPAGTRYGVDVASGAAPVYRKGAATADRRQLAGDRAGRAQTGQLQKARQLQIQIGDVAERPKASILEIEHEGSNPSFTAERTGDRRRDQAPRSPGLWTLNNHRVVQRDQHSPRDAHATGRRATRAASPSLPRRAAAGRWLGALPSGRRFEPPDA